MQLKGERNRTGERKSSRDNIDLSKSMRILPAIQGRGRKRPRKITASLLKPWQRRNARFIKEKKLSKAVL